MAIFTAALAVFLQADSGAGSSAPQSTLGFSALAGMMGNIGPIAIAVLVLLLVASLYSWTVILGKISTFSRATKQSKQVHPRIPQGDAAAGHCGGDRRLQRQPAGAGL